MALPDEGLERLKARARQPESLVEFFAKSPLAEVTIDLEREPDYGWVVEL
jgi:hypothetical protein